MYLNLPVCSFSVGQKKVACLSCFVTAEECHLTHILEYRVTYIINSWHRTSHKTAFSLLVNTWFTGYQQVKANMSTREKKMVN